MSCLSLCTGYGGLDLAVDDVFGATTAMVSEVDPAACSVLDARFPGVPNLGDLTAVDWADVPPVDLLTAGYPCQPFFEPQDAAKERRMPDTSGPTLPEPLAFYDPDSSSWRTSAGTFPWEPPPCLETLPASGMTLAGVLYELPMSAPATAEPGCSLLLPTATAGDAKSSGGNPNTTGTHGTTLTDVTQRGYRPLLRRDHKGHNQRRDRDVPDWGAYGPAIARHAAVLGRPAPNPVDARGRLNPAFVEWMMMLPEGWVTDVVTNRSKALKVLGNGVVPPQAACALRLLCSARSEAAA